MKRILLALSCIVCLYTLQAQTLYGTSFNGGTNGKGTITKLDPTAGTLTAAYTFEAPDGERPQFTNLVQASNGKLYGMTRYGGSNNYGTLFSYDPTTSTYIKLKDFDVSIGTYPSGSLMQASDGKLYGMTSEGGSNNAGVIFCYAPATSSFSKLKDLDFTNGAWPYGHLIQATDGKLYGMTSYGGSRNAGVIFCFAPSTSTLTKLYDFDGGRGGSPYGSLIQATDGKLYGMTAFGGSNGYGAIFCYNTSSSTYTKLKDFNGTNGSTPYGSLVQATNGKLYGMTYNGGFKDDGVIFCLDPSTLSYTIAKDLDATNGDMPCGSLMKGADGKLYGSTTYGGSNNVGVIFSLNTANNAYTKLSDLSNVNGGNPQGNLVQATNGKMYSLTTNGGTGSNGVIFAFDPNSSSYTKLKDFGLNSKGSNVYGGVIQNASGKLYGMANTGGNKGAGVIYCFDPATSVYSTLYNFDGIDGGNPRGTLLQAENGKLYGMTYSGGNGYGVIFSFNPSNSQYSDLYNFNYTNGGNPTGNLIQAANGKLYGLTYYGGANSAGVLFSFDPVSLTYTKLIDFDGTNGAFPYGSLVQGVDNKLYGMTYYGGTNSSGVIFSFNPSNGAFAVVNDFADDQANNPSGNLVQAVNGKLYGMTQFGGNNDKGIVFSFDPANLVFTKQLDFTGSNGSNPYGSLLQAADGKLYGTTYSGGSSDAGVAFSFAPASSTFVKIQDFNGVNGKNPFYTSFTGSCLAINYYRDADGDGFGSSTSASIQACVEPVGYAANNTDCNDNDANEKPNQKWYFDADGDGYAGNSVTQCTRPANGFLLTEIKGTGDCKDNDNSIHPNATEIIGDGIDQDCDGFDLKTWYADTDGDGFGDPNDSLNDNNPIDGYVTDNTDCNDEDATIHAATTYYADADGDGYGNAMDSVKACGTATPTGYVTNKTDCNDASVSIHPNATEIADDGIDQDCDGFDLKTWYQDLDGDGFGNVLSNTRANTQPAGYVADHTDCDDTKLLYIDADGDGFGAGNPVACGVGNNTDCNDNALLYADADGDGFGAGSPVACGISNNTDCNDTDAGAHAPITYYRDNDGDGYGSTSITTQACTSTPPAGYVINNSDCNDNDNSIYPGAPELCDSKDNNCNGSIDENATPVTYYKDGDGDSYGNKDSARVSCSQPIGYVKDSTDCNDRNASVHKGTIPVKATISGNTMVCPGKTTNLISSNAVSYLWNTGATTKTITTGVAGFYTVSVTRAANGCASKSDPVFVTVLPCSSPTNLSVTSIATTSATLNWGAVTCAARYKIQIREIGKPTWRVISNISTTSYTVTGLLAGKNYEWQVQTICNTTTAITSDFTNGPGFTTATSLNTKTISGTNKVANDLEVIVSPNPAQSIANVRILHAVSEVHITLTDLTGKAIWKADNIASTNISIPVAQLANGTYLITVRDTAHSKILKLVKAQ